MIGEFRNSQMINDYVEFSGEDMTNLVNKLSNYQLINKTEFHNYQNSYDFYEKSDTYIYDLLFNNTSKDRLISKINLFSPFLFKTVINPNYKSFLEFGGGLGLFCEIIKMMRPDMSVNYADIKSKISDFAKWRFERRNIDVNQIIIPQNDFDFPQKYDVIFTDAVIEHLDEEQQVRYMQKLSSYVNNDGILIPLIDLTGKEEIMPMHNDVNIVNLHNILENSGMYCLYGKNTFSSIWKK